VSGTVVRNSINSKLLKLFTANSMVMNCVERSIGRLKAGIDNNSFREKS